MTYDALIVLANEMDRDGVLNKESASRANLAAKLANDLQIPYVITSGWAYRHDSTIKVADAFKNYLTSCGIKDERVITETSSRDTVGDAVFTRAHVVEPRGLRKLCVVTSSYHAPRTKKIFQFVYGSNFLINVVGAEIEFDDEILSKETASTLAFERTFKDVQEGRLCEIMDAMRHRHPFYNGQVYEKI